MGLGLFVYVVATLTLSSKYPGHPDEIRLEVTLDQVLSYRCAGMPCARPLQQLS